MNKTVECRTPEYTASRAYSIHIVASDHKRKDPHAHTTSTTVPVVEYFKSCEVDVGEGKSR